MPPITTKLDTQLWDSLKLSLKNELYTNASFLGERLLAQTNCEEVRLKLAKAYNGTPITRRKQAIQGILHTQGVRVGHGKIQIRTHLH